MGGAECALLDWADSHGARVDRVTIGWQVGTPPIGHETPLHAELAPDPVPSLAAAEATRATAADAAATAAVSPQCAADDAALAPARRALCERVRDHVRREQDDGRQQKGVAAAGGAGHRTDAVRWPVRGVGAATFLRSCETVVEVPMETALSAHAAASELPALYRGLAQLYAAVNDSDGKGGGGGDGDDSNGGAAAANSSREKRAQLLTASELEELHLALFLMHTAAVPSGAASRRWRPLLRTLPLRTHAVAEWSARDAAMLGGSPALLETAVWLQRLRRTHAALIAPLAAAHPVALPPDGATFARLLHATLVVRSTAFHPPPPTASEARPPRTDTERRGTLDASSHHEPLLLLPVAGMINHAVGSRLGWRRSTISTGEGGSGGDALALFATRDVAAGTSLRMNYGPLSTAQTLTRYGFVEGERGGGSAFDTYPTHLELPPEADGTRCAFKTYLLRVKGLPSRPVLLWRGELNGWLIELARVAVLSPKGPPERWKDTYDPWRARPISVAHERRTWRWYANHSNGLLRRYRAVNSAVYAMSQRGATAASPDDAWQTRAADGSRYPAHSAHPRSSAEAASAVDDEALAMSALELGSGRGRGGGGEGGDATQPRAAGLAWLRREKQGWLARAQSRGQRRLQKTPRLSALSSSQPTLGPSPSSSPPPLHPLPPSKSSLPQSQPAGVAKRARLAVWPATDLQIDLRPDELADVARAAARQVAAARVVGVMGAAALARTSNPERYVAPKAADAERTRLAAAAAEAAWTNATAWAAVAAGTAGAAAANAANAANATAAAAAAAAQVEAAEEQATRLRWPPQPDAQFATGMAGEALGERAGDCSCGSAERNLAAAQEVVRAELGVLEEHKSLGAALERWLGVFDRALDTPRAHAAPHLYTVPARAAWRRAHGTRQYLETSLLPLLDDATFQPKDDCDGGGALSDRPRRASATGCDGTWGERRFYCERAGADAAANPSPSSGKCAANFKLGAFEPRLVWPWLRVPATEYPRPEGYVE